MPDAVTPATARPAPPGPATPGPARPTGPGAATAHPSEGPPAATRSTAPARLGSAPAALGTTAGPGGRTTARPRRPRSTAAARPGRLRTASRGGPAVQPLRPPAGLTPARHSRPGVEPPATSSTGLPVHVRTLLAVAPAVAGAHAPRVRPYLGLCHRPPAGLVADRGPVPDPRALGDGLTGRPRAPARRPLRDGAPGRGGLPRRRRAARGTAPVLLHGDKVGGGRPENRYETHLWDDLGVKSTARTRTARPSPEAPARP
ncbi:hypothetical protein J116_008980 [Streptomyces thermolilacinus SPC6]|uniref:Uncharacterized protein n=1 Tax=Streptomyces thermolilacinus SPC6 TaxID=1306406 RepID=A0A1D3DQH6_9ACTN|nr:hypothetical protein J116_008980 [Streptomyces thermolilacinus SPC6]